MNRYNLFIINGLCEWQVMVCNQIKWPKVNF
jgi:hypothetical protein